MKESKVEEVIDFVGEYTANVISSGALETVCIPYFGKFIAKLKQASFVDKLKATPKIKLPIADDEIE